MEVQAVLDKARETIAHDGAVGREAKPPKRTLPVKRIVGRLLLPVIAIAGIVALLRPRKPAKPPKARFPIPFR